MTRKPENGGVKVYRNYAELEKDYLSGDLHPGDLKPAVAAAINDLLQPVRDHFENDPYANTLLKTIRGWQNELALAAAKQKA